jgi:hypothetical protein
MNESTSSTRGVIANRSVRFRRGSSIPLVIAISILGIFATTNQSAALPKRGDREPGCLPGSRSILERVSFRGTTEGTRILVNSLLGVDTQAAIQTVEPNCEATRTNVPSKFTLTPPSGSSATIGGGPSNATTFKPDVVGDYVVTVRTCAKHCGADYQNAIPATGTFRLTAVAQLAPSPKTDPVVPAEPHTDRTPIADKTTKCADGGGIVDPQWVPVTPFTGPQDYRLVQGTVKAGRVSRKDSPMNHDSQDANAHVEPDPMYRNLSEPGHEDIEIEWETNHFPEEVRPSVGDRLAVWGFHILDCGHDFGTEIHPPIGLAVSRARAVEIPESARFDGLPGGVGRGVTVPGIDTVIYFHPKAGEITSNCSSTGLHQAAIANPKFGQQGQPKFFTGACIKGPHQIQRQDPYEFDIYLPPNPSQAGKQPVPLFVEATPAEVVGASGPAPKISIRPGSLHVTLDFSNGNQGDYRYRIRAAWAYPSPDNWQVKAFRFKFTKLDVLDDGDGLGRGDGDWRFWINVPSRTKEWTKLFDGDGNVTGVMTFGGRPWSTGPNGSVGADRWLGPDPLLFPGQRLHIHTSGYEADSMVDDDTGTVDRSTMPGTQIFTAQSLCAESDPEIDYVLQSGCASYIATFAMAEVASANPVLSPGALELYNAYALGSPGGTLGGQLCSLCDPVLASASSFARLAPPRAVELREVVGYESEREQHVITEALPAVFSAKLTATRASEPEKLNGFLVELRDELALLLATGRAPEIRGDMEAMQPLFPADLWAANIQSLVPPKITVPRIKPQTATASG